MPPSIASKYFRHRVPADLQATLDSNTALRAKWERLTPLGRNEWVCWMTSAKKQETRDRRLSRLCGEVLEGKKRPCCWPGCPHRSQAARKWVKA